jgi:hypothetical protein
MGGEEAKIEEQSHDPKRGYLFSAIYSIVIVLLLLCGTVGYWARFMLQPDVPLPEDTVLVHRDPWIGSMNNQSARCPDYCYFIPCQVISGYSKPGDAS